MKCKACWIWLSMTFVLLLGCETRVAQMTVLSTKNVPQDFQMRGQGTGSDARYYVLIFPTRISDPNMGHAVEKAIDKQNGDVLLNAHLHWSWWYIPLIFGRDGFTAAGDVANTHAEPGQFPPPAVMR